MKANTANSWGSVARGLHWLIALLIIVQLPLGYFGHEMDDSPNKIFWLTLHKSLGVTVLVLMALRLAWRVTHPVPKPVPGTTAWQRVTATSVHWALYLVVFLQTLSGWVAADTSRIPWKAFWVIPLPDILETSHDLHEAGEEMHEFMVWMLLILLAVHVGAALWHHFVRRDDVLRRIWSG